MTTDGWQPVSASRTIEAAAEELFAVLADPARHPYIDGSGMLRRAVSSSAITGVGDTFTMSMHNAEMGDYEITNHVVEYERNRRIGWEPVLSAASRAEDQADIGDRSEHRWIYTSSPSARPRRSSLRYTTAHGRRIGCVAPRGTAIAGCRA